MSGAKCKNCGEALPRERVVELEVGDNVCWVRVARWIALVALAGIIFGAISCLGLRHYENKELDQLLSDPNVKVEYRQEAGATSPTKIFTREADTR